MATISDVIERLEESQDEHGDLECVTYSDGQVFYNRVPDIDSLSRQKQVAMGGVREPVLERRQG